MSSTGHGSAAAAAGLRVRPPRGMVAVEMAFGLSLLVIMMAAFAWVVLLVGAQIRCVDTATELARQAARGNQQAVQQAKQEAPEHTEIIVDADGADVLVTVRTTSDPAPWLPAVTVEADATAIKEPGQR